MENILVVVDMQKDFIDGALGSKEAIAIIPASAKKIRDFDGKIFVTFDTHAEDYLNTQEGRKLPVVHCVKGTEGWKLDENIRAALEGKEYTAVEKHIFGSIDLPDIIKKAVKDKEFSIELIGVCTDICLISNALILKSAFPNVHMSVDSSCCAGVTPELHEAALKTMSSCQIDIK